MKSPFFESGFRLIDSHFLLLQMTGTQSFVINYQKCQLPSGVFEIGLTQAIGVGVVTYSSSLQSATVNLPSPAQDPLTTVIRDCNAEW